MPTILLADGYRFYFYMNEHLPIEIVVKNYDHLIEKWHETFD
ncbi:MAG: hypothetical protein RLN88_12315 [Ekhidna sp.]